MPATPLIPRRPGRVSPLPPPVSARRRPTCDPAPAAWAWDPEWLQAGPRDHLLRVGRRLATAITPMRLAVWAAQLPSRDTAWTGSAARPDVANCGRQRRWLRPGRQASRHRWCR